MVKFHLRYYIWIFSKFINEKFAKQNKILIFDRDNFRRQIRLIFKIINKFLFGWDVVSCYKSFNIPQLTFKAILLPSSASVIKILLSIPHFFLFLRLFTCTSFVSMRNAFSGDSWIAKSIDNEKQCPRHFPSRVDVLFSLLPRHRNKA